MIEFPQMDSGLVVLMFTKGDDPLTSLNKAMAFLTAVASLRECTQPKRPRNAVWFKEKTEDLDAYDFDYDDVSNAKAVLMTNLSNYGSDIISEVP
nr:hypothetical protein [Tanacetum cinerariifolium]